MNVLEYLDVKYPWFPHRLEYLEIGKNFPVREKGILGRLEKSGYFTQKC